LHDTTERIQGMTQTRQPRKSHKFLRALLISLAVAAIGAGVAMFLQRRSETRDVAPDVFGDGAGRDQRARDFASIP
jgi:TPP-dependent pyruvate/acetoin dehydrogenase alpha subunit